MLVGKVEIFFVRDMKLFVRDAGKIALHVWQTLRDMRKTVRDIWQIEFHVSRTLRDVRRCFFVVSPGRNVIAKD